jgi:hypothetical protein
MGHDPLTPFASLGSLSRREREFTLPSGGSAAPQGLAGEGVYASPRHPHLCPIDHRHANLARSLVHLRRTTKAIMVGHSKRRVSKLRSYRYQLSRMGSPVEEAHVGVAMQLCVSDHGQTIVSNICSIRFVAPSGGSITPCPDPGIGLKPPFIARGDIEPPKYQLVTCSE